MRKNAIGARTNTFHRAVPCNFEKDLNAGELHGEIQDKKKILHQTATN